MSAENFNNGSLISVDEAKKYIDNYRNEDWSLPFVRTDSMLIRKECLENIMVQPNCTFVRFFMAKTTNDEDGQYTLVIVGADEEGNNIINKDIPQVYQELGLCPPTCDGNGVNI